MQNKLTPTKTTNGVIWTNKEAQVFKLALSSRDYKKLLLFFKILQIINLHGLPLLANKAIMVLIAQMNMTLKITVES